MSGRTFLSQPNFRFTTNWSGQAELKSTWQLYAKALLLGGFLLAIAVHYLLQGYGFYLKGRMLLALSGASVLFSVPIIVWSSWAYYMLSLRLIVWSKETSTLKVTLFPAWCRSPITIDTPFELILDEIPMTEYLTIQAQDSKQELLKLRVKTAIDPVLEFCEALEADGVPFTHNVPSWRMPEAKRTVMQE